jgi:hypothetical protein
MTTDTPAPKKRAAREPQNRRPRLTEEERAALRKVMAKDYRENWSTSIRSLAEEHDRSYGLVRVLLLEAKVELRNRTRRGANKRTAGAK